MVEIFHPFEFRFICNFTRTTLASGHVGLSGTTVCGQDDDILCIQLSQSSSGGDRRLENTQVSSQRSHGKPGPKSPARRPTHRSGTTRSQDGDLVGKYGVQASASDLEALPLGPNPHQAILPWGAQFCIAPSV